jgi:hypothetical protein
VISPINDQSMDEGSILNVPFTVAAIGGPIEGTVTVTGTSSNTALVSRVDISGSGTNFVASIQPLPGKSGQTTITLTAADALASGTETFVVTVLPLNAPSIAPIPEQTTFANTPVFVNLTVTDADTPVGSMLFTWATSNTNIVRNVTFGISSASNVVATVRPVQGALGQATVTIFVDDGRSTTGQSFILSVIEKPNEAPVFAPIADQTTTANKPVVIALDITDDTPLAELVFTSGASNPNLVSGVTVDTSSGVPVATVNLVQDATGISTVTITVNDGKNTVSQTFALQVNEAEPEEAPELAKPTITVVNGIPTITVTWTNGGELETAPGATGPWTATGNTSGTYSEPATGASKMFRVVRR